MRVNIPIFFDDIAAEIVRFTPLTADEVRYRTWMESLDVGWNVKEDCRTFGVTPHIYNDKLIQLYKESYGFIFETLVFWAKPTRQFWIKQALERIQVYIKNSCQNLKNLKILMLGDGAGNDSLFLINNGFNVDYFDMPGSKTFNFAYNRFNYYDLIDNGVSIVTDYSQLFLKKYDIIICFEVLEHLPDPISTIRDMGNLVKDNAIILITEAFKYVNENLPTHLSSNEKYSGLTPFYFLKEKMLLTWYSKKTLFKPLEFTKRNVVHVRDLAYIFSDIKIWKEFLAGRKRQLKKIIKNF
jgi:SAM-dependent methyltransferase